MSVISMKKVHVIGLDTVKEDLISQLIHLGCVQINDEGSRLNDERWAAVARRDGGENGARDGRSDGRRPQRTLAGRTVRETRRRRRQYLRPDA